MIPLNPPNLACSLPRMANLVHAWLLVGSFQHASSDQQVRTRPEAASQGFCVHTAQSLLLSHDKCCTLPQSNRPEQPHALSTPSRQCFLRHFEVAACCLSDTHPSGREKQSREASDSISGRPFQTAMSWLGTTATPALPWICAALSQLATRRSHHRAEILQGRIMVIGLAIGIQSVHAQSTMELVQNERRVHRDHQPPPKLSEAALVLAPATGLETPFARSPSDGDPPVYPPLSPSSPKQPSSPSRVPLTPPPPRLLFGFGDGTVLATSNTYGPDIWIQACHGVGHALTWWAPTGSKTPGLSAAQMVDYCLQRGSAGVRSALDDTCSAACTSGMFHEASTAGILHSIANDAPHPCANLERHTLFCYAVSPAQSFTHCYELSASLRNQAGCVAALGIPDSFRIERSEIASPICAEVRSRSVALWLACGYGAAWWYSMMKVHASTTMGHSPAMGHSGRSVAARCIGTWPHDEFAREICIQEASVVFSSAFLLDDLEFLTQLNFPAEFLATHEGTFQSLFERVRSTWRVTNADVSQPLLDVASGRDSVDTANIPAGQRTSWRILNDKRRQPLLDIRMDKGGVPSATGVNLGAS